LKSGPNCLDVRYRRIIETFSGVVLTKSGFQRLWGHHRFLR
jgi:hypothetical protein